MFQYVIPWKAFRYQILHHASVYGNAVMFVAATGSDIEFVAYIKPPREIGCTLSVILRHVQDLYIPWSRDHNLPIPAYFEVVYGFGKDYKSVKSDINVMRALHRTVLQNGTLPSSKYLRPRLVGWWNLNKGGTDVMSRVVSNCHFKMSSMHPKATMLWRFIQIAAVNVYYVCRLARSKDSLGKNYRDWRRQGANRFSYRECLKSLFQSLLINGRRQTSERTTLQESQQTEASWVNNANDDAPTPLHIGRARVRLRSKSQSTSQLNVLRQNMNVFHECVLHSNAKELKENFVKGTARWCVSCSKTTLTGGVTKKLKRTGHKTRYQCKTCKVFLCRVPRATSTGNMANQSCWDRYHGARSSFSLP